MALVIQNKELLKGKVVVDPTNPIKVDANGALVRSLPEGESSGSVVARLLPLEAHYVKAFGSPGAQALAASANRSPRAVLFYATDDAEASSAVERLISAAGFDPIKAGGLTDVARLEMPDGDLSQGGGLKGALLDADQARSAIAAPVVA
jgi:8-hydroxy-5-deazaflavin:NADPH oxidoreductase